VAKQDIRVASHVMATITIPSLLLAFLTLLFTPMPVTVLLEPPLFSLMCIMAVTLTYILKCQLKAAVFFIFLMFSHRTPPQRIVCNMTRLRGVLKDNAYYNKSTTSKDPLPVQFHIHLNYLNIILPCLFSPNNLRFTRKFTDNL
jgi:hypothetical protein